MKFRTKRTIWTVIAFIVIAVSVFVVDQFLLLQKAHSTFDNYYVFRGCTQLISRTDTSGVCKTASDDMITIVEIDGKWYLQGDGPGVW